MIPGCLLGKHCWAEAAVIKASYVRTLWGIGLLQWSILGRKLWLFHDFHLHGLLWDETLACQLQENLIARRTGRDFSTTVNCTAERFCMLLPEKMSISISTTDLMIDLKFSKIDATLITLKLPKKIFFSRKPKRFLFYFCELEIWMIF